ncbi:MAG: AMP-binding protein, partial [Gemmobacter sp.]
MADNHLFDALFAPLDRRTGDLMILPDGRTITGAAFHALVLRMAAALAALGVIPGDRVAVQVAKSPEALALY